MHVKLRHTVLVYSMKRMLEKKKNHQHHAGDVDPYQDPQKKIKIRE